MYFKKLGDCLVSPVWGIFKDLIGSWHMMEQMRFSCYNKIEKKITANASRGKHILRNAKILRRNRVYDVLSAVYNYPLTILEAPMGYGKTTAARSFFETRPVKPVWVTFGYSGGAAAAFWDTFTCVIGEIDHKAGAALHSLGFPADIPQTEKTLSILNNIAFPRETALVLDDYQFACSPQLTAFLLRLPQEDIANLHILLMTRDTTDIDFVELFSKGLCHIVSRQEVKFTDAEVSEYCRMMAGGVSEEDLRRICEYTDGWISFVYMILMGLVQGIPVGMTTIMEDLIETALFKRYDRQVQEFLLMVSIMNQFTARQAEFVTQDRDAGTLLKKLNRENAFVYYDEKSKMYSIHNILLDFLRVRQNFSAETAQGLYVRLGDWHLARQEFQTAYGYWNRAGQAERILSHLNDPQNIRNELITFDGADAMFDSLPRETLFRYPFAYLLHIFYSLLQGKKNTVLDWTQRLDELERYYVQSENMEDDYRNRVLGETLIVRKFTLFNHLATIRASNQQIVRYLKGQNSYITLRRNEFTFGSPHYLYIYFRDAGSLRELSEMLSQTVGYAEFADGCGTGCDSLALAEYALETGNFADVERHSIQAAVKADAMSQTCVSICAKFCLIRLRIVQGRVSEALDLLAQLQCDVSKMNKSIYNTTVDLCKGYVFASIGYPEQIPSWLLTGDMTASDLFYQGIAFNYLVYGKAVMASKKYIELEALTAEFEKNFSLYSNQLGFIHNGIFMAAAKCKLYGVAVGSAVLAAVLNEARADRLVMPFVESAPHILEMLQWINQKDPGNAYVGSILSLCRKYAGLIGSVAHPSASLSPRETELLALMAEGLNRRQIAEHLCITEETAKSHMKNIYQKLEVNSKVAAIQIARNRGYLANC